MPGAPLEEEEISLLDDYLDDIKPFMTPEGIREIERIKFLTMIQRVGLSRL